MNMVFANRLKKVRERSGMKRKEVAEKLGITLQAYSAYEEGKREPRLDNLIELANIFDMPIGMLCSPYRIDMSIDGCSSFINTMTGCSIKRMAQSPDDYLVTIPYSPEYPLNLVMSEEDVISMCLNANGSSKAFFRMFKNRYLACAAKYASTNKVVYR